MSFAQILWLTLAYCAEVNASEIPLIGTRIYSSGGLATASNQTVHTIHPWHKILNSGGILSNEEKSHELRGSQPSTQVDMNSIKFTEQIKSVLDPTGLEHLEQCTSYLTQEDMGIKNVKLKKIYCRILQNIKKLRSKHNDRQKVPAKNFLH